MLSTNLKDATKRLSSVQAQLEELGKLEAQLIEESQKHLDEENFGSSDDGVDDSDDGDDDSELESLSDAQPGAEGANIHSDSSNEGAVGTSTCNGRVEGPTLDVEATGIHKG